jgi:hypothetical protein
MCNHKNLKIHRSHGVTVSTQDSESCDRGSNPREAYFLWVRLVRRGAAGALPRHGRLRTKAISRDMPKDSLSHTHTRTHTHLHTRTHTTTHTPTHTRIPEEQHPVGSKLDSKGEPAWHACTTTAICVEQQLCQQSRGRGTASVEKKHHLFQSAHGLVAMTSA